MHVYAFTYIYISIYISIEHHVRRAVSQMPFPMFAGLAGFNSQASRRRVYRELARPFICETCMYVYINLYRVGSI